MDLVEQLEYSKYYFQKPEPDSAMRQPLRIRMPSKPSKNLSALIAQARNPVREFSMVPVPTSANASVLVVAFAKTKAAHEFH